MSPKLDAAAQDSRREEVAAWCRRVGLAPEEIPAPTGARNDMTAAAVDEGHIEITYRTYLREPDGKRRIAIDPDGAYFIELSEPLLSEPLHAIVTEAPPGFRSLTWSAWEWITTGDRGWPSGWSA
jgi:hypothetical protein